VTAHDWLAVLVLVAVLVFAVGLDAVRRAEERRHERANRGAEHRWLMDEIERQP
jgi:hypothetical protein